MKKNNSPLKLHIRTGDIVKVIAGNYKGKTGKILAVYPKKNRALVENINMLSHYIKPSQEDKGGIKKKEGSIHISNLALINPSTKESTKIGRKKNSEGSLQRYSKKTGSFI